MIEIRITIEAFMSILVEKMKIELKHRQRSGLIPVGLKLEELNYSQFIKIVEASIFDTLFMLPIDLVIHDNNITYIITEAVKSLGKIFKKDELFLYNKKNAKKIVDTVIKFLSEKIKTTDFHNN
ncbi:hypothetical protein [Rosettibacter firmus]|uniref:hypothetical protein n=1 Tax=Rosettibacter firmus TaxID=3111522 RepID=UPI00336BBD32